LLPPAGGRAGKGETGHAAGSLMGLGIGFSVERDLKETRLRLR